MQNVPHSLLLLPILLACTGCTWLGFDERKSNQPPDGISVEQMNALTNGGKKQAVLSLHRKISMAKGCRFGLTLTNRLPYGITNIALRFTAYTKERNPSAQFISNFFEIDPTDNQYREIDFPGFSCESIDYLEVSDPGRCTLGDLSRFTSQPGQCIRLVHIAESPYVRLVPR